LKKENIHPIKIFFGIPVSPGKIVERSVYAYIIDGERLCLVDAGVAGAEKDISIALQTQWMFFSNMSTPSLWSFASDVSRSWGFPPLRQIPLF